MFLDEFRSWTGRRIISVTIDPSIYELYQVDLKSRKVERIFTAYFYEIHFTKWNASACQTEKNSIFLRLTW